MVAGIMGAVNFNQNEWSLISYLVLYLVWPQLQSIHMYKGLRIHKTHPHFSNFLSFFKANNAPCIHHMLI